jgi:lipopolysaccharide export system protein LptC
MARPPSPRPKAPLSGPATTAASRSGGLRFVLAVFAVGVSARGGRPGVVEQLRLEQAADPGRRLEPLVLNKPRFTGVLKDGRAVPDHRRRAPSAIIKDQNLVRLTSPVLVRGYGAPDPSQATAKTGLYREAEHTLLLSEDVKITSAEGYAFDAPRALINMRTGEVSGESGIEGTTPKGSTQANAYNVTDKGDRVVLKGRVRTRLNSGN